MASYTYVYVDTATPFKRYIYVITADRMNLAGLTNLWPTNFASIWTQIKSETHPLDLH